LDYENEVAATLGRKRNKIKKKTTKPTPSQEKIDISIFPSISMKKQPM
jgi:hypothetical protein